MSTLRRILDHPVVRAAIVNGIAFGSLFAFAVVTQWLGLR